MAAVARKTLDLLALARLSNAPTVVTNVLAGCALGGVSALDGPVLALGAAMVCFYAGGMILNDLQDLERDRVHEPQRPLPSGRVAVSTAWRAVLGLFAGGAALTFAAGGLAALACAALLVALIVVYDCWHRHAASALVMAATRGMVYVTACVAVSGSMAVFPMLVAALMLATYVAGLALLARSETDLHALRAWPVLLVGAPLAWLAFGTMPGSWTWSLAAAFAFWVVLQLRKAFVLGRVGPSIGGLVAGIALLDAAVLARCGQTGWAIAAIAAFALTRLAQRHLVHRD